MTLKQRKVVLTVLTLCVVGVVCFLYIPASKIVSLLHTHSYQYSYYPTKGLAETPAAVGEPAMAVPILMYHGVRVDGELGMNTTREHFIDQMEMLKKEGYQTISVNEYDLYRQGKFMLPVKPIIITFDDGRKDSFYTVDEIFNKLGFKATAFIASVKPNQNDPFFLSWDELKDLQKTNRWEIEAHGRHSHDVIVIDEKGTKGTYLSSRIYDSVNGLESVSDFEKRIESDYQGSLSDLASNLGVKARYYAIPLNDYGEETTNYEQGATFNRYLTKKYFKFSFVQSLSDEVGVHETFYNYADSDPYTLKRLEVKNMTAEELQFALDKYSPSSVKVAFPFESEEAVRLSRIQKVYGNLETLPDKITIKPVLPDAVARTLFGDKGWKNYTVDAEINRGLAREASLFIYYLNEDNMILLDWNQAKLSVIERVDGVDSILEERDLKNPNNGPVHVSLTIKDGYLSASFDGVQLVDGYHTSMYRGAPGFGVWDPEGNSVTLTSFQVSKSN